MLGCTEHEVGQSPEEWLDRVHPEDRPAVQAEIDAHLAQDCAGFTLQHRMRHRDGSYRWMACQAVIVRDDNGRPVRMMGFHADVTADRGSDILTGLPNRLIFLDRLERAIDRAQALPRIPLRRPRRGPRSPRSGA